MIWFKVGPKKLWSVFPPSQISPVWALHSCPLIHRLCWAAEGDLTLSKMQTGPAILLNRLVPSARQLDLARDPSTALRHLRTTKRKISPGPLLWNQGLGPYYKMIWARKPKLGMERWPNLPPKGQKQTQTRISMVRVFFFVVLLSIFKFN